MFVLDYRKPYDRYWSHGEAMLKSIVDILGTTRDEDFDMKYWIDTTKKCGCALSTWIMKTNPKGLILRFDGHGVVYPWVEGGAEYMTGENLAEYFGITVQDLQQLFTAPPARQRTRTHQIEVMNWYINARQLERIRDADNEAGRVGVEGSSV